MLYARMGPCFAVRIATGYVFFLFIGFTLFTNWAIFQSVELDVNNSRLKKKNRKKRNRRNREQATDAGVTPCLSNAIIPTSSICPSDVNNAMFALHSNVLKGTPVSPQVQYCGSWFVSSREGKNEKSRGSMSTVTTIKMITIPVPERELTRKASNDHVCIQSL